MTQLLTEVPQQQATPQGWQCPKCGQVLAPSVKSCDPKACKMNKSESAEPEDNRILLQEGRR